MHTIETPHVDRPPVRLRVPPYLRGLLLAAGLSAAVIVAGCGSGAAGETGLPSLPIDASALPSAAASVLQPLCDESGDGSLASLASSLRTADLGTASAELGSRIDTVMSNLDSMDMTGISSEIRDEVVSALSDLQAQVTSGQLEQAAADRAATALEGLDQAAC